MDKDDRISVSEGIEYQQYHGSRVALFFITKKKRSRRTNDTLNL